MKPFQRILAIFAIAGTQYLGASTPVVTLEVRRLLDKGLLPAPEAGRVPWGGPDKNKWRPEAILANAASLHLNDVWKKPDLIDALVAIPTDLIDSKYNPYGDGQTNSYAEFGGWLHKTPPLVAVLQQFQKKDPQLDFNFSKSWKMDQSAIQIAYKGIGNSGEVLKTLIVKGKNIDGQLTVEWDDLPNDVDLVSPGQKFPVLVRPYPGFEDWFPIYFRLPRHSIKNFLASVPEHLSKFSDGKPILDPEGIKPQNTHETAIDRALSHRWPKHRYNINLPGYQGYPYHICQTVFMAESIMLVVREPQLDKLIPGLLRKTLRLN